MKLYNLDFLNSSQQILQHPTYKKQGSKIPILFHVSKDGNLTKLTPGYSKWYWDGIKKPHMCFSKSIAGACVGGGAQFDAKKTYLYTIDNTKITAEQLKGHLFSVGDLIAKQGRFGREVDVDIEVPVARIATIERKQDPRGPHIQTIVTGYVVDPKGEKVYLPDDDPNHKRISTINDNAYLYFSEFIRAAKKINKDIPDITEKQFLQCGGRFKNDIMYIDYYPHRIGKYNYKLTDIQQNTIQKLFGKVYLLKFKAHAFIQNKKFDLNNKK